MSEAENHPPASSVTALRIPIIKKGEYDLCFLPQSTSVTEKLLIVSSNDKTLEKSSNILLSAIPDRHLLSFHDAQEMPRVYGLHKSKMWRVLRNPKKSRHTSRQSTADDKSEIITKGYAQASSSKLKETLNSSFNSDEIICSFFAQQASMPETHDDEDLLQK
ncbi:hypothetical protein Tco_0560947 [Tanacetum coccineum]